MSRKLLIWNERGEVVGAQEGGITEAIIGCYEAQGEHAAFFDRSSLDYSGVFIHRGQIRERPKMFARIDKTRIKAGGIDCARIIGVPRGAQVEMTDGLTRINFNADGTTLEIPSPIPARWVIDIDPFPHQPQQFIVDAE